MPINYPIKEAQKYYSQISKAIDNYQKIFGITVEVFRLSNRNDNNYLIAYGKSQNVMSDGNLEKVFDIELICYPQDLYVAYSQGSGSEIKVYTSEDKLKIGDVIRYQWMNNVTLEFSVNELPNTLQNTYYEYNLKSLYQVKNSK